MRFTFAIATRDELRLRGRVVEQRLSFGVARHFDDRIDATDERDDELVALCDESMVRLRAAAPRDARVRLVATARRVRERTFTSATMTIGAGGLFVVTDADHAATDFALLRVPGDVAADPSLPMLWRNGSAAVLLHEAVGHPAEHEHDPLAWPAWLSVDDEPRFALDDLGNETRNVNLLAEAPAAFRRESFRDVPLRRMSHVSVRQHGAPFELPSRRIEIHLVSGGSYEPLGELVSLFVAAADLVDGGQRAAVAPFAISHPRAAVPDALIGARGEPVRYPGVVCSSEGQELVVGSSAPELLTWFR